MQTLAELRSPKLILAPLKGYTDEVFRNAFARHFDGFDSALAPFIPTVKDKRIRPALLRGVQPERNRRLPVVPQIMSNSPDDFIRMACALVAQGHSEVNWNLGCPFPMVAKKSKGSGLLPQPDRIDTFLDQVVPRLPCRLSVKVRLGRKKPDEIYKVLESLNAYPLSEIIVHPRTGIQMYSGRPDLDRFERCLDLSRHPVSYNGDINCFGDFQNLSKRFQSVTRWMIGRGALINPYLPGVIKGTENPADDKVHRFIGFYYDLYRGYQERLSGPGHLLNRMKGFWTYFALTLEGGKKVAKQIHRSKRIHRYETIVSEFFSSEPRWVEPEEGMSVDEVLP